MAWYRVGTITAVNNTNVVTGIGTTFDDPAVSISAGDSLIVGVGANLRIYEIQAVVSPTRLTLATNTTLAFTASAYQIQTSVALTNSSLAKKVAATMDRMLSSVANWMQVLTGSGNVTITDYNGVSASGLSWPSMASSIAASYGNKGNMGGTVFPNNLGNTSDFGIYFQTTNSNSVIANGYPIGKAGTLYVTPTAYGCQQMYITYQGEMFTRGLNGTFTPATPNWDVWTPQYGGKQKVPLTTGVLEVLPLANGGTASNAPFGNTAGKFAQGNDVRLNTVDGKSGGTILGTVSLENDNNFNLRSTIPAQGWPYLLNFQAGQGNNLTFARINHENGGSLVLTTAANATAKYFVFATNGNLTTPGNITCVSLTQTSDSTKKDKKEKIENALEKVKSLDGITFVWKETGIPSAGIIAQQLKDVLPESIGSVFEDKDEYGEVDEEVSREITDDDGVVTTVKEMVKTTKLIRKRDDSKRSYTVEYSGVVALLVEAVKELSAQVDELKQK